MNMENSEIIEIINNLKGRRNYEERKATNLVSIHFMHILKTRF